MTKKLVTTVVVLAALALATSAFASQYPPGPGGAFPDTLSISNLQDPAAVPFPANGDTIWGISGIITGFDPKPTGFAFYIQSSSGAPYTGIDVFTGAGFRGPGTPAPYGYQLGDSVVCYGRVTEFGGGTELTNFPNNASATDLISRFVSSGHPLPPIHVGTMTELQELPTNTAAEPWEGMLVRVNGPLKVARTSLTGGLGTNNSFLLVDPACPGPFCDSLFVDGNTLATYTPPAVLTVVDWVQGVYDQRARGYRIQLRDGNDISVATPPSVNDAYPVTDTRVRVVFDRNVTTASATNLANYSLGSGGGITAATMDGQSAVFLDINNGLADGDPEQINVNNVVGLANGLSMTSQASRNFSNGVLSVALVQGPNADSLVAVTGCKDVANFLAGNNGLTARLSVRGVCAGIQGSLYTLMDAASGPRSGVAIFAPSVPLVIGHDYLVVCNLQEFPSTSSGETELVNTVYIVDNGAVALPTPVDIDCSAIRDTTCDATQSVFNGEDVEGTIAKVSYARIVGNNGGTAFVAGANFRVVDLTTPADTFFVANNNTRTFLPVVDHVIDVTGIVQFSFGAFRMQPRNDADIVDHGSPVTGVNSQLPRKVEFAVAPNPARTPRVSFGLPVRNTVALGVFDLAGRKIATLANGVMDAGRYSRTWNGLDDGGRSVGSGVYFYRLQVGTETHTLRSIKLD